MTEELRASAAGTSPETLPPQLPVGRELDALVAERVMGWKVTRSKSNNPYEPWRWLHAEFGTAVPQYSEDIGAAWLVVEKMRADDACSPIMAFYQGYWRVAFSVSQGFDGAVYAETAPLAICRAALAARMGRGL